MVHGRRLDEAFQLGKVAEEEMLQNIPVRFGCHCGVGASRRQRELLLYMPERLKQVKHVVQLLVEKLPHERGAGPGGGQQEDVLPSTPRHILVLAVVLEASLHQHERRIRPVALVRGDIVLEQRCGDATGVGRGLRDLPQGQLVRHPERTRVEATASLSHSDICKRFPGFIGVLFITDMSLPRDNIVFLLNDNKCHKKDNGYCVLDPHSWMQLGLDVLLQTAS